MTGKKPDSIDSSGIAEQSQRNRIELLRTELQTCLTFADVAETEEALGDPANAARSRAHAETAYATILRFMSDPKHARFIPDEERVELTRGPERLRAHLDKLAR